MVVKPQLQVLIPLPANANQIPGTKEMIVSTRRMTQSTQSTTFYRLRIARALRRRRSPVGRARREVLRPRATRLCRRSRISLEAVFTLPVIRYTLERLEELAIGHRLWGSPAAAYPM